MSEIVTTTALGVAKIVYTVQAAIGDTNADPDREPDIAGVSGSWKLTPVVDRVLIKDPISPRTVLPMPIVGTFVDGKLSYDSQPYVVINVAPRDEDDQPYFYWLLTATYMQGSANRVDTFTFDPRANDPDGPGLDLTMARPLSSPGAAVTLTAAEQAGIAAAQAQAAALDALQAAQTISVGDYLTTEVANDSFAPTAPISATAANTARFLSKLRRGIEDIYLLVISDSTGNENIEHVYLEVQEIAARFPALSVVYNLWDATSGLSGVSYLAPTTIQNGTGPRTLYVHNMAIPGANPGHVQASVRWTPGIVNLPASPDLIMISHGHNMGTVDTANNRQGCRNALLSFTEEISELYPNAGIVLESQNPTFVAGRENWQGIKARIWQDVAAQRGYGFIDVHEAFQATGNPAAYVKSIDGVHPTTSADAPLPNGSRLWADTVIAALKYDPRAAAVVQRPSALTESARNLIDNGDFADWTSTLPDGWSAVNATVTKDTTNFETGSCGARIVGGAASGSAHIERVVNVTTAGIRGVVSGRVITVKARVYVPASGDTVRLTVVDQTGSANQIITDVPPAAVGRFVWVFATKRCVAPTTSVTVRIAARTAGTTGGDITVDRIEAIPGDLPYLGLASKPGAKGNQGDPGDPTAGQWDHLATYGDHPATFAFAASAGCGVVAANQANLVRVRPFRNTTVAQLVWMVHTTGGNYDIGIYTIDGTRLWSKGSTATPAVGLVTETVSPTVSLTASTWYWIALAFDATTQLARGALASNGDMMRSLTGAPFQVAAASAFPLPASLTPGTAAGTRIPAILLRES